MTRLQLSLRSTWYYACSHLSVLAGITLAVTVLVGALLVGDSVKYTLRHSALLRLGGAHYALEMHGRYMRADLADRLQIETSIPIAPALVFSGVGIGPGERQVNRVQIVGVDERFRGLVGQPGIRLPDDGIALNNKLAAELGVREGNSISIRFSKPSLFPQDAPLSSRKGDETVRGAFTVVAIWSDEQSGRFSLTANQLVPYNAFISLKRLQELAGLPEKANLLLAGEKASEMAARQTSPSKTSRSHFSGGRGLPSRVSGEDLDRALKCVWRLDDMGLRWRKCDSLPLYQLESDRIMLDSALGRVATGIGKSVGALTYLVNSISLEGHTNSTPYSFVMAMAPAAGLGPVPVGMNDDEILVNRWTADQLALRTGDSVRVAYYEFTQRGRFVETSRVFRVKGVIGMELLAQERELAPHFPGLTDAGRCSEWDIGMPLDPEKVEDKSNEAYWNAYRDTPKAFVTLKAGQAMWSNQFGDLTAIRFKTEGAALPAMEEALRNKLNPVDLGFFFSPVRRIALKAAGEAMDFGQLLLGMSGFVVLAALMLTALMFSFSIQQRSRETGILLAVGFTPARVRWLLIREEMWVAIVGGVLGAGMGMIYTHALIWALGHSWQGAVVSTPISYHAEPLSVIMGVIAGILTALFALVVATWRQTALPARELLAGDGADFRVQGSEFSDGTVPVVKGILLPCLGLGIASVLVVFGVLKPQQDPGEIFFVAGALLLASLLGLIRVIVIRLAARRGGLTLASLGIRNVGRHRRRSLTVVGLLAVGCFMVFAVSSMQENIEKGAAERSSGTGGFALYGESSIPILADLSSPDGWKKLRLDRNPFLMGIEIIPIKVHDGDDASCLNLNRAQSPRLLGVDPVAFDDKGAFAQNWSLLVRPLPDGCVPGLVGDANTAQWGLQKNVGDILLLRDERSGFFKVKIMGHLPMRISVFQGSVLISKDVFSAHYPSESGTRMFLADVPKGNERGMRKYLTDRLAKFGLNVILTVDRLKEFNTVESAYLGMFLVLGGLGLLLGSVGMAIVVLRAIRERRAEFALLKAVGYSDRQIRGMIAGEHRLMLGLGLAAGLVSSMTAMWPNLRDPGVTLPLETMLVFLSGITVFHLLWIEFSIRWALRVSMLSALRNQ